MSGNDAYIVKAETLKKLLRIALWAQMYSRGRLGGQSITNYACLMCENERTHPDTAVPYFCEDCTRIIREEMEEP